MAEGGCLVDLIAGRNAWRDHPEDILRYYGISKRAGLTIHIVPMLRRWPGGPIRLTWMTPYHRLCLMKIRSLAREDSVIYTRHLKLADSLIKHLSITDPPILYEAHESFSVTTRRREGMGRKRLREREGRVLRRSSGVVSLSEVLKNELEKQYGNFAPAVVIPHGAPPPNPERRSDLSREIVYIGQLYPWKRVDLLIAALPSLPDVQARIIGGGSEDIRRLKATANRLGVSDRVVWMGQVSPTETAEAAGHATAAVITGDGTPPGAWSPPLKLFEYMSMGLPIVACATPAVCEILTDGESGILIEPGNPMALAQGLRAILDDPKRAAQIVDHAKKLAVEHSWEARGRKIVAAARGALDRREHSIRTGRWKVCAETGDLDIARSLLDGIDKGGWRETGRPVKRSVGRRVDLVDVVRGDRMDVFCIKWDDLRRLSAWRKWFRHIFAHSRARVAWRAARYLRDVGIQTPRPIFVAEQRIGPLLLEAILATEGMIGSSHIKDAIAKSTVDQRRGFAERLGEALGRIHRAGIAHGDCKPTNFLLLQNGELSITDLENASFHDPLPTRFRSRDIARLLRDLEGLWDHLAVSTFLRAYASSFQVSSAEDEVLRRLGQNVR